MADLLGLLSKLLLQQDDSLWHSHMLAKFPLKPPAPGGLIPPIASPRKSHISILHVPRARQASKCD